MFVPLFWVGIETGCFTTPWLGKLRFSALKIWIASPKLKVVGSHGIHITRSDHSSSNTFLAITMQHVKAKCETVIA